MDAIIAVDDAGRILLFNCAAERVFRSLGRSLLVRRTHDLAPQDQVGIDESREEAVEEALSQAREWPRPGLPEHRRPVALNVTGAHELVEECLRLERSNDPSGERVAARGVPRARSITLSPSGSSVSARTAKR